MLWRWEREHIAEFAHFGKWISISSTATFISGQGDRLFIGLFLSSSILGLYSIAKLPMEALSGLYERLNSSLATPVLGEVIRSNQNNLKRQYYRFRLPFDLTAPFLGGFVCSGGALIIRMLYDARYIDAGYMLQLLAVGLLLYPSSLISSAFSLTGNPRVAAIVSAVQAASLFAFMIFGYLANGVIGVITAIATYRIVPSILILILAYRQGWIDLLKELRVVPVFGIGLLAGKCVTLAAEYALG
jgi:O-antigen/teichoic acid export membrane protein